MKSYKVLIVDDDSVVLDTIRLLFEQSGFKVIPFKDPILAFESIKRNGIDIIITDYALGSDQMSGISLSRSIREIGIQTPIILYSGRDDIDRLHDLQDLPNTVFLKKPVKDLVKLSTRLIHECGANHKLSILMKAEKSAREERLALKESVNSLSDTFEEMAEFLEKGGIKPERLWAGFIQMPPIYKWSFGIIAWGIVGWWSFVTYKMNLAHEALPRVRFLESGVKEISKEQKRMSIEQRAIYGNISDIKLLLKKK